MIRALAFLLVMTSAAQAGAWEEFQSRCLIPMENVRSADTSGLPEPSEVTLGGLVWMSELEGAQYQIPGEPLALIVAADPQTCIVVQTEPSDEDVFLEAEAWSQMQRDLKRYEDLAEIQMGKRNFNMGSTDWREPRLDIFGEARDLGKSAVFYVMETDLEA